MQGLSILERAETTKKMVTTYQNSVKKKKELGLYKQLSERLAQCAKATEKHCYIKDIIADISSDILENYTDNLYEKYLSLQEAYNNQKLMPKQVDSFKSDIDDSINKMRDQWSIYLNKQFNSYIDILRIVTAIKPSSQAGEIIDRVEELKNKWPLTNDTKEKLKSIKQDCENEIKNLDLTDNVTDFLRKLVNKNAVLADLTPEVRQWIKDQHLEKTLKLVVK